jgi:glutathione S-transferase
MTSPVIKFTYFDIEGKGESIRLALRLSQTPFEDIRVTFPEWPELKPSMPYGQIPVMTIDNGPMVTQSKALLRYVGTTFSQTLYPVEKLLAIEEAIGVVEDFLDEWRPRHSDTPNDFFPEDFFGSEEGKLLVKQVREKFVEKLLPKYMSYFTALLEKNDGKWLASTDEPTIADCYAIPFIRQLTRGHIDHVPTTCLDGYPKIIDYIKRFCALEQVKGRYNNGVF